MKETCQECKHSRWLVGVGQGFRCDCKENQYKLLNPNSEKRKMPVIPNREFICEHFDLSVTKRNLEKLIFRLNDKMMDGITLSREEISKLDKYKKQLKDIEK
jgi:hypothetical protein